MIKNFGQFGKTLAWITIAIVILVAWAIYGFTGDVDADNKPYSVSLNSPVTFPVDI